MRGVLLLLLLIILSVSVDTITGQILNSNYSLIVLKGKVIGIGLIDNDRVIIGYNNGLVEIYSIVNASLVSSINITQIYSEEIKLRDLKSCRFNRYALIIGEYDISKGFIILIDSDGIIRSIYNYTGLMWSISFSDDCSRVVVSSTSKYLLLGITGSGKSYNLLLLRRAEVKDLYYIKPLKNGVIYAVQSSHPSIVYELDNGTIRWSNILDNEISNIDSNEYLTVVSTPGKLYIISNSNGSITSLNFSDPITHIELIDKYITVVSLSRVYLYNGNGGLITLYDTRHIVGEYGGGITSLDITYINGRLYGAIATTNDYLLFVDLSANNTVWYWRNASIDRIKELYVNNDKHVVLLALKTDYTLPGMIRYLLFIIHPVSTGEENIPTTTTTASRSIPINNTQNSDINYNQVSGSTNTTRYSDTATTNISEDKVLSNTIILYMVALIIALVVSMIYFGLIRRR